MNRIGPRDLTEGTVEHKDTVPTVTDSLFAQGRIANNVVSVYFQPSTKLNSDNGELTFGGIDKSKVVGDVTYSPISELNNVLYCTTPCLLGLLLPARTSPSDQYWGINQTIKYGHTTIQENTAGIVDTGTTLQFISSGEHAG